MSMTLGMVQSRSKNYFLFTRILKIFSKTTQQNSYIFHTDSPWICVIKVCSSGGATYITDEILAKDNLNIANLMQTSENLFLQFYSAEFLDDVLKKPLGMCN